MIDVPSRTYNYVFQALLHLESWKRQGESNLLLVFHARPTVLKTARRTSTVAAIEKPMYVRYR